MTWSPRNRCEDDDLDDREDGDQRIKESESKRSDKEDERRRDEHHHSRPGGGMCQEFARVLFMELNGISIYNETFVNLTKNVN